MINNQGEFQGIQSHVKKIESMIDEELINKIASEYVDQLDLKFNNS